MFLQSNLSFPVRIKISPNYIITKKKKTSIRIILIRPGTQQYRSILKQKKKINNKNNQTISVLVKRGEKITLKKLKLFSFDSIFAYYLTYDFDVVSRTGT